MKRSFLVMALFGTAVLLMASPVQSQPPGGKDGRDGKGFGKGGPGAYKLGVVIPPQLAEELKLSDDQKAKLADIEKELKAKLEKLLTDDQKKIIENFRPGPGGGRGGPGGGGPGGKGGGEKRGKGPQ